MTSSICDQLLLYCKSNSCFYGVRNSVKIVRYTQGATIAKNIKAIFGISSLCSIVAMGNNKLLWNNTNFYMAAGCYCTLGRRITVAKLCKEVDNNVMTLAVSPPHELHFRLYEDYLFQLLQPWGFLNSSMELFHLKYAHAALWRAIYSLRQRFSELYTSFWEDRGRANRICN